MFALFGLPGSVANQERRHLQRQSPSIPRMRVSLNRILAKCFGSSNPIKSPKTRFQFWALPFRLEPKIVCHAKPYILWLICLWGAHRMLQRGHRDGVVVTPASNLPRPVVADVCRRLQSPCRRSPCNIERFNATILASIMYRMPSLVTFEFDLFDGFHSNHALKSLVLSVSVQDVSDRTA